MGKPAVEIVEHSIVLLGSFNPTIFHPQWMARKEIIPEGAATGANVKVNHSEVSEFDLENCKFQVLPERFLASSRDEEFFKPLRDLVIHLFTILLETPIYKMGLNHHWHYKFEDADSWHKYGHKHAPKDHLWNDLLENPGLSQLNIIGKRDDEYKGTKTISTGISNLIPVSNFGVSISVNDHYDFDLESEKSDIDAQYAKDAISKIWDKSKSSANEIQEKVLNYGCE
jgi:hypothetical protein